MFYQPLPVLTTLTTAMTPQHAMPTKVSIQCSVTKIAAAQAKQQQKQTQEVSSEKLEKLR